jgi:CDP-6-deoxy-D-xylo-4-hexulose-3-dehydrase
MNTFSFFHSHQIGAIEGGMILTNDDECARLCRVLRAHGWTRDVKKPERFDDEYDFELMGYNVRPLEIHAAVARVQLRKLTAMNDERRTNYRHFLGLSAGLPIEHPHPNGLLSPFGLPFLCESAERRAMLVDALRAQGIDCRLPTGGSFRLHRYGAEWAHQKTHHADDVHRRGLFLGNAPYPIPEKIERAVRVMRDALLAAKVTA